MKKLRVTTVLFAVCSTATVGLIAAPAASAQENAGGTGQVLNSTVLAPFQIAISKGSVYFTDGFMSTVNKVGKDGASTVVVQGPEGGEVAGVEFSSDGKTMAFASTDAEGNASLTIRTEGEDDVVADLSGFEAERNPDGKKTYGIIAGGNPCAEQALAELSGLDATYTGIVESHPYQVEYLGGGAWAVADAAGNDVLKVDKKGKISVIARLPRQPHTFTAEQVAALGIPECIAGVTYAFEPVPTDVEKDGKGNLLVSTLPGGPEDSSLGARGAVYKVNQSTGNTTRVADGLLSATNLAVADGTIYVTELFNGRVARIRNGKVSTAIEIASPLSVEVQGKHLYVGTMAEFNFETGEIIAPGSVQRFRR